MQVNEKSFSLVNMEKISGIVDHIVFSSEESGWTVARLKVPKVTDSVCIVGNMPGLGEGETVHCEGEWITHPKHGMQFQVESVETKRPSDVYGIQKYLESGLIKGIGPVYAEKIVAHFAEKTLEILDLNPYMLLEIEGIGEKRVEQIRECWDAQKTIRNLMIFLQKHNVKPSIAQKVYKVYGEKSIEVIEANPYALAKNVFGIGFKSADEVAQKIGIPTDSPLRVSSGITHLLWELSNEGNVCYPEEELVPHVAKVLDIDETAVTEQMDQLEGNGEIVRDAARVWIKPLFLSELGIARELTRLQTEKCTLRMIDGDKGIAWVEDHMQIKLASEQKEAICTAMKEKVHLITGGPGTGKSTITKAILRMSEKLTGNIVLAAPTGRASKRMSEITRRKASTIHALLEFDFQNGGFKRSKENPIECDLIIIDEASMIDTQLMYSLVKAIPDEARVILIGDIDQLPSVGPGSVLKDLIDSDAFPVTKLQKIFRQGKGSRIVTNAHSINGGYIPKLENEEGSDFVFVETEDQEQIVAKILELVQTRVPKKFGLDPIDDIQVLAPMKRGQVGTDNLNQVIQQTLNPQTNTLVRMGRTFSPHDKVMQIRNNYTKHVYNGDVGRIVAIDHSEQEVEVNFEGKFVYYAFSELDELMLAYAVSVHKYQGSECPCIIMPIHTSHFKLLQRNLLYTGITRGKQLVILIGTKKAIGMAVSNDEVKKRHSGLKEAIQKITTPLPSAL